MCQENILWQEKLIFLKRRSEWLFLITGGYTSSDSDTKFKYFDIMNATIFFVYKKINILILWMLPSLLQK